MIGQAIGPYEIVREIGRGGMGVVYLARDTNLDRDVAIKMLPDEVAGDPERLARFERESKLLASLRHANIAAVYGLEEVDGKRCLVLEYVDGEDLSRRLGQGPIPMDEALVMARELAEAIEAAHAQGIIHRDLKPGNIKVNAAGEIRVLDFGLAKALHEQPSSMVSDPAQSPTVVTQHSPSVPGVILGTAGYMSPEQARGRSADKRSDIWSFGCVLFEMLSGAQVFGGETVTDSLGAILHKDPPWALLPPGTPPTVQLLLRRCLTKDRKRRLQDIGDARIELEEAIADPTASSLSLAGAVLTAPGRPAKRRALLLAALLAIAATAVGAAASWLLRPAAVEPPLRKFAISVADLTPGGGALVSPDGRSIAYVSDGRVWVRRMDSLVPRELPGTDEAQILFWSPDGRFVGYVADSRMWKVPADGGRPAPIASLSGAISGFAGGAAWCRDGRIIYTTGNSGLLGVPAQGGDPVLVLDADPDTEDDFHDAAPLPDGRGIVFVVHRLGSGGDTIAVFDGSEKRYVLQIEGESLGNPCYSPTGHIVYYRQTTTRGVWAVPFALSTLEATGEPFLVAPDCAWPSVASDGTLVIVPGAGRETLELAWIERDGTPGGVVGQPQHGLFHPRLSPDGTRVAASATDNENREIWVHDVQRGTASRLSFTPEEDWFPHWTPDGGRVAFITVHGSEPEGLVRSADGTGSAEEAGVKAPLQYSRDGRYLIIGRRRDGRGDLGYVEPGAEAEPVWLLASDASEGGAALSPDGRYLAYESDESGQDEIFLTRFPDGQGRWQVSLDGGEHPRWNGAGDELFFSFEGDVYAVTVQLDPSVTLGTPHVLFAARPQGVGLFRGWDVTADGQRFLVVRNQDAATQRSTVTVVQNWIAEFADE